MFIPGGFKCNEFASAYSKGVAGTIFRKCAFQRSYPPRRAFLVSLHFQRDPARSSAEIPGLEAESVSVNMGVACVDMVRAKSSPSRIESRSMGRAYVPFRAKRFSSRKFVAQRLRIRKALGSMTRITLHVTTRQVERMRALRIFFREIRHSKRLGPAGCSAS